MRSHVYCLLLSVLFLFGGCHGDDENIPQAACITNVSPPNRSEVPENSTIELSWEAVADAHSYDLYVGVGTAEPALVATDVSGSSKAYLVPPGKDITYTWYVRAKDANGNFLSCENNIVTFTAQTLPALDSEQIEVNVLVISYDPYVTFRGPATRLHAFYSWSDPRTLAEGYINDVLISSHNLVKCNIIEWRDIDKYPHKKDGFVYNDSTYLACMFSSDKSACHMPDELDYYRMIEEQNIVEGINNELYDEVWIFGAPYFGFWESAMAGPNAFYINGGIYNQVSAKRSFAIMGFSYERGIAEMMHDLCHRTESTMTKVYGSWQAEQLTTPWARFAANEMQSGTAAVGSCHYPPNAADGYDYANARFVSSSAEDWSIYPLVTGKKNQVNSETWGGPDYQRSYLNWWFSHLPRRIGTTPDGRLNCWWRYLFEFNETIP